MVMWAVDRFKRYVRYSGRVKFFLCQSIGIDETNTFQLKFFLGGLWALDWSWQLFLD